LSATVQTVLLAVRHCVHRAWLAGVKATRRHLRDPRAHLHHLLLRVFPRRPAAARHLREDQAVAEFDFGIGAGREAAMRGRGFIPLRAGLLATWPLVAHAQNSSPDYPDRAITLIVPYAPGGGNDALARAVAEHMGKSLGQALVIENRGGAGGAVGTRQVAKAA